MNANELKRGIDLLCQSEREGWRYADEMEQERKRLHEVNQELLEALELMYACFGDKSWISYGEQKEKILAQTKAAIAKATGEQA